MCEGGQLASVLSPAMPQDGAKGLGFDQARQRGDLIDRDPRRSRRTRGRVDVRFAISMIYILAPMGCYLSCFGEFLGSKRCGTLANASERQRSLPIAVPDLAERDFASYAAQPIAPYLSFWAEARGRWRAR